LRAFAKIRSAFQDLMRVQDNVEQYISQFRAVEIIDGTLVPNLTITTAGLVVEHNLKRQPLGWILVDNTADARVWRLGWNVNTISLDASATTTFSLWVF
jgi:hypothetical protein